VFQNIALIGASARARPGALTWSQNRPAGSAVLVDFREAVGESGGVVRPEPGSAA
jgi:hypothetical protein